MIRDLGGLQNIVDKKQWVKVADAMKIPKAVNFYADLPRTDMFHLCSVTAQFNRKCKGVHI